MAEERKCFILAGWVGERADFSAGINLPWPWCWFTLPADVCTASSVGSKATPHCGTAPSARAQGRMQSCPERQEEPGRAHLPRGQCCHGLRGSCTSAETLCSSSELPKALLPFLPRLEGEWFLVILLVCEVGERRQWKISSKTVHALLMWSIVLCFCRRAPSPAEGKVFLSRPRLRQLWALLLPLTVWSLSCTSHCCLQIILHTWEVINSLQRNAC